MRLTSIHARFWQSKQPAPAWTRRALLPKLPVADATIHACINAHAGYKYRVENSVSLLRSHRNSAIKLRRDPSLLSYLIDLGSLHNWSFIHDQRRSAWARKWARRIARERGAWSYAEVCARLAQAEATAQYRAGRPASAYTVVPEVQEEHTQ